MATSAPSRHQPSASSPSQSPPRSRQNTFTSSNSTPPSSTRYVNSRLHQRKPIPAPLTPDASFEHNRSSSSNGISPSSPTLTRTGRGTAASIHSTLNAPTPHSSTLESSLARLALSSNHTDSSDVNAPSLPTFVPGELVWRDDGSIGVGHQRGWSPERDLLESAKTSRNAFGSTEKEEDEQRARKESLRNVDGDRQSHLNGRDVDELRQGRRSSPLNLEIE
jgi:hypothetical protein